MRKFQVGDQATFEVLVDDKLVRGFADLSGDHNPIHLDDAFAAGTRFGRRIAHGMISGCLISRLLATELPGPGTVYLGQSLRFKAPIFVGERVTVHVRVSALREEKGILTVETSVRKEDGTEAVTGEATVLARPT